MRKSLILGTITAAVLFSGCSFSNPFGIGHEKSVCADSRAFGVCGNPKAILKYKDRIKAVQDRYLKSGIKYKLFFAVDKDGNILVKRKRNGKWQFYATSKWKRIIDAKYKIQMDKLKEEERKALQSRRVASPVDYGNDIPVTEGNDLSVRYERQGPLVRTRTAIGDIIRDSGRIQKVFIANYVDTQGDLVASHDVYVVVKNPKWIVGERTPKSAYYKDGQIPTPLPKSLLDRQTRTNEYQENVVRAYNNDSQEGIMKAVADDVAAKEIREEEDMEIIKNFINSKKENLK